MLLVLITHDESTFNANGGKRSMDDERSTAPTAKGPRKGSYGLRIPNTWWAVTGSGAYYKRYVM